jgi:hypothetical protein
MMPRPLDRSAHRFRTSPLEGDEKFVDRAVVVPLVQRERPSHQRLDPREVGQERWIVRRR